MARSRAPLDSALPEPEPERVLTRRLFWVLAIATGIVSGAGVMKISHLAAIVIGQGYAQDLAVNLLAASGAAMREVTSVRNEMAASAAGDVSLPADTVCGNGTEAISDATYRTGGRSAIATTDLTVTTMTPPRQAARS